ncbi:putative membrane protein [Natronospira proteinivora]|uniref:Membrane protein n=1 Tax=Natronospira proteinivora TaxID=1807133 RepID=A0ABT1GAX4_9GAMM|nr:PLDc N-terminal domain-containing protein [Natronospira proteinivora]MCP1728431.1 putative membrane protein [Natronospira proteinivora]
MGLEVGGLLGLIWLIIVVWAIIRTAQSRAADPLVKAIWIVVLLVLPVLGLILWLLLGPR